MGTFRRCEFEFENFFPISNWATKQENEVIVINCLIIYVIIVIDIIFIIVGLVVGILVDVIVIIAIAIIIIVVSPLNISLTTYFSSLS